MTDQSIVQDEEVSKKVAELAADMSLCRRMNDPVASAFIKGPCGDTMEFYLVLRNGVIEDVSYHTDGCEFTRACGAWVAKHAKGHNVDHALNISAGAVSNALEPLPQSHRHCPILAVTAFYRAVADYLLKP